MQALPLVVTVNPGGLLHYLCARAGDGILLRFPGGLGSRARLLLCVGERGNGMSWGVRQ